MSGGGGGGIQLGPSQKEGPGVTPENVLEFMHFRCILLEG